MSPHAAADIDNAEIKLSDFKLPEYKTQHLIVEGAGGLILNGEKHQSNKETIERFGDVAVFEIETLQEIDSKSLPKAFKQTFQLRIKN